MAHIKSTTFEHAPTNGSGYVCDRCGQRITNIYTVSYANGVVMHFCTDCFEKLGKESGLNAYIIKVKKIKDHYTVQEVINLTTGHDGHDIFKRFFE